MALCARRSLRHLCLLHPWPARLTGISALWSGLWGNLAVTALASCTVIKFIPPRVSGLPHRPIIPDQLRHADRGG